MPLAVDLTLSAGLIKGINEVEDMLKFNIAQARLNERGNYGKLGPDLQEKQLA